MKSSNASSRISSTSPGPAKSECSASAIARHYNVPLAASWHTNVHEYLARRSDRLLRLLPQPHSATAGQTIEDLTLAVATSFYSNADLLFAPNPELCAILERATGRPCHLMPRGVDSVLFHPRKRTQTGDDREFVLGYVGRLSIEKNVALLARVQRELEQDGNHAFPVSDRRPRSAGILAARAFAAGGVYRGAEGRSAATAYANMDLFVFPSHTDTFGNVVLEALSSGVPAIVTPDGGPAASFATKLPGGLRRMGIFIRNRRNLRTIQPCTTKCVAKHEAMRSQRVGILCLKASTQHTSPSSPALDLRPARRNGCRNANTFPQRWTALLDRQRIT